jgi:uncharacterized protein YejL (UPF0352 family)
MIASLASFTGQYPATTLQPGRSLFENSKISKFSCDDKTYKMTVSDGVKDRQVSVRVEGAMVTNIFCTCGPTLCRHVIAAFFHLKKKLAIKEEAFSAEILEPSIATVVGNNINNLIYTSRRADTKDGELEKLGMHTSLSGISAARIEAKATGGLSGHDHHPIFTGAKRLLGAAIREFAKGNYEEVLAVAKGVLTGILKLGIISHSAQECCDGAVGLLDELYQGKKVPAEFKEKVFRTVINLWRDPLYEEYDSDLIEVIGDSPISNEHAAKVLELIQDKAVNGLGHEEITIGHNLLLKFGKEKEAAEWKFRFPDFYMHDLMASALEQKNYPLAKLVAESGIKGKHWRECRQWLYEIALAQNDHAGLRDYHVTQLAETENMIHYEKIKEYSEEHEWKDIVSAVLHVLEQKKKDEIITEILIGEGLTERLIKHVRAHPHFRFLIPAAPLLVPTYQTEILALLKRHLVYQAPYSKNTEGAKAFAEEIKQIRRLKGGKEMVSSMLKELFEKYPGWKVMRSVVGKYI